MVCKVLEPPHMASSGRWLSVLEALGHIKQVDPALLIELVKKIPDISDDLPKNAREIVALRFLESLYENAIKKKDNLVPLACSQIEIDPSDCCEDVLRRILQGEVEENQKSGGPEILKWDIRSFIMHKRSCLPSGSVQKLKEVILEGNVPLLSSWKDRSGLATNESQRGIPVNGGDSDGMTKNEDELLQETSHDRNLLPAKRDRSATIAETCEQCNLSGNTCEEASKKLKEDFVCMAKNVHEISGSVQQHGFLADSSARVVEHIQDQGCKLEVEIQTWHTEESGPDDDHHREDDASTRQPLNNDACHIEMMHDEQQATRSDTEVPGKTSRDGEGDVQAKGIVEEARRDDEGSLAPPTLDAEVPEETSRDGEGGVQDKGIVEEARRDGEGSLPLPTLDATNKDVVEENSHVHEANNNLGVNFQQNVADGDNIVHDDEHHNHPNMSSDSDGYDSERVDVASKKNVFLNSQCMFSEDSETLLSLCVKCNKGGYVLVCSSDACPLVVHESCLGSTANFDGSGNFFCPFCSYSRAISGYLEAKKKSSLARKDLSAFIGMKIEQKLKKSSMRSHGSNQNHCNNTNSPNEVNDSCYLPSQSKRQELEPSTSPPCVKGRKEVDMNIKSHGSNQNHCNNTDSPNEVNDSCYLPSKSKRQELEPSRSRPCVNPSSGREEVDMNIKSRHLLKKVCQSAGGQGKKQPEIHGHKAGGDISHCKDRETIHGSQRPDQTSMQKVISHQSESDQHLKRKRGSAYAEGNSVETSEKTASSKYSIRTQEHTHPVSPELKRKKVPWTQIEEETIKEGAQRFKSDHDKKIQWKKILEYGGDVFQRGRTAADLKDKWKSMRRVSNRSR